MKLTFLLKICLLSSCTSTSYESTKLVTAYAGPQSSSKLKRSLEGVNQFYMWGLLPSHHIVNIDQDAVRSGLSEFSLQKIEEFQTIKQFMYSFFTFGMYIPQSYRLVGYGIKSGL